MKIYFYYDKNLININENFKYELVALASTCFKVKKNSVVLLLFLCEKILVEAKNFDYYVFLDEYEVNDIVNRKNQFSLKVSEYISKTTNHLAVGNVVVKSGFNPSNFSVSNETEQEQNEFDYQKRTKLYVPSNPRYSFENVMLPESTKEKIEEAISVITYEEKVFNKWGLRAIQPNPSSALSFFGSSGTGKTMAAEAVAQKLGKKILRVSYADIESKYHGEGAKMVKAIFMSAQENDAVLFIDEADSLLSKRLTNVTQGSEQAINSMRSQLLICLEEFHGICIFATNLVVNYDNAFLTRLISIEFVKPDIDLRKKIWDVHLYPCNNGLNIPLTDDINTLYLAKEFEFCGREIRNAVISTCVRCAMKNKEKVSQTDLIESCNRINEEMKSLKVDIQSNKG